MRTLLGLITVALLVSCGTTNSAQFDGRRDYGDSTRQIQSRVDAFLLAVDSLSAEQLAGFFPKTGTFTYRRTIYMDEGSRTVEQHFPAAEIPAALMGPLAPVLTLEQEGRRVGLFAHQVRVRRGPWRNVGDYRFVPSGGDAASAVYVQWRLEDGVWVISELADEEFRTDNLPAWCC